MPVVRRTTHHESEAAHGARTIDIVMHVRKPAPEDTVIPISEVDDTMLADLAETHPEEYAAHAKKRGLTPAPVTRGKGGRFTKATPDTIDEDEEDESEDDGDDLDTDE